MKILTPIGLTTMMCITMLVFTSCSKEDPVTPVKSTTPQVSKIASQNFVVSTWVFDEITKEYQGYIIDTRITQDILDKGGVQVFLKAADNQYTALPNTTYATPAVSFKTNYSIGLQLAKIELQYPDLKQGPAPGVLTFKLVIVSN